MNGKIDKDGYREYHLKICGKSIHRRGHRLIAETFLENPNNYPIINHKNGIKDDNRVENIEWCSYSYNSIHSCRVLGNKPIRYGDKKVSSFNISTLEYLEFNSISSCARYYGVCFSAVSHKILGNSKQPVKQNTKLKNLIFKYL